jgi:hypothetical protein
MINSIIVALVSAYITAYSIKKGYVHPDTIVNAPKKIKEKYEDYKCKQKSKKEVKAAKVKTVKAKTSNIKKSKSSK